MPRTVFPAGVIGCTVDLGESTERHDVLIPVSRLGADTTAREWVETSQTKRKTAPEGAQQYKKTYQNAYREYHVQRGGFIVQTSEEKRSRDYQREY